MLCDQQASPPCATLVAARLILRLSDFCPRDWLSVCLFWLPCCLPAVVWLSGCAMTSTACALPTAADLNACLKHYSYLRSTDNSFRYWY